MSNGVFYAIAAAVLFGASTPLATSLLDAVEPVLLSGLLYLGSGVGLVMVRVARDGGWKASGLQPAEWRWLAGAIAFGGVLGPVALMQGLTMTAGATASLLLNLEAVLTALIAWVVFRENADRRVVMGMVSIVAGGVVLSWPQGGTTVEGSWLGPLSIAAACLFWGIDNNLTRKVSGNDALLIAGSKGLVAGVVNIAVALSMGAALPEAFVITSAMTVGLLGYGVSLVLFVLALRGLGTARTGAYFSVAPFVGALVSIVWLNESASQELWIAGALMAVGVWLHLSERHEHEHTHEPMEHEHTHVHDEHHQHEHEFPWEAGKAHTHVHRHMVITHQHPHFPDIHHRHGH